MPASCGSQSYTYNFTAWASNPYSFTQTNTVQLAQTNSSNVYGNVFCGNVTIGGNGSTDTFAPGIYYIYNGSLTFNNADITSANGVTFVLTGTNPGSFNWTNYSNTTTLSAPTTGDTAGITVWQTGSTASGSTNTITTDAFNGGSTLQLGGAFYAHTAR
jgi:hypothetical protein